MKRCLGGVAALVATTCVMSVPSVSVGAAGLTYPSAFNKFPVCAAADQEFCIEKFEFTPASGAKQDLTATARVTNNPTSTYLDVFIGGAYTGPGGSAGQGGLFPSLAINYMNLSGSSWNTPTAPLTLDGIPDGAYRTVVRTGDYDPSYLLLQGKFDAYSVIKGADGYFTVDVTAKPAAVASTIVLNGDSTALNNCRAGNWVTNCESNSAYRRYILTSFAMSSDSAQRELLRGTWISTNASTFGIGRVDLSTGVFDVSAEGPHYVPADFGMPGLTTENGRELNPAFFEMSMSLPTVAKMLTQLMGREVTVETAKKALEDPTKIFEGTIDEATAGQVTEKLQQLTMTVGDSGLRVNFNLAHFSAPNPTVKVKSSSAQQTLSVLLSSSGSGASTGGGTSTAPATNYVRTAASGAKATLTINLLTAQKIKVYRKEGSKLTLLKTISAKKGTNRFVTVYKKTYTYVVKDAKGKVIPPQLSSTARRFGLLYLS